MEGIFSTGNETVDRLSRIRITGNVIPSAWYRTIRKETGKPYLNAIVILSDIVYWYRAAEIRDEGSGQLLGYKKKFKADLLQRSYAQLAEQFGISKRDATNAVVELEKLGVIKRVFRTLVVNGQAVPNVLFLSLDVEVLEYLTFPERGCHLNRGHLPPESERGITGIGDTPHENPGVPLTEMSETNTEITYKEYHKEYPIESYQDVKEEFKAQIEYEILKQDQPDNQELDELVEIAVEVLTSKADTIRVNREERETELVKQQYRKLNLFHIQYVLNSLQESETKARNIRAVIITALYNAPNTIDLYYGNLVQIADG
ncbi:MAG: DUF6017 domain-containing protein [Monoglobales bacterium]